MRRGTLTSGTLTDLYNFLESTSDYTSFGCVLWAVCAKNILTNQPEQHFRRILSICLSKFYAIFTRPGHSHRASGFWHRLYGDKLPDLILNIIHISLTRTMDIFHYHCFSYFLCKILKLVFLMMLFNMYVRF